MGTRVLTLAQSKTRRSGCGQLSEDSASRERDADPQEANVLDRTGRVSRLMAKTRRDNSPHIVSGRDTVWETVTTGEVAGCGQTRDIRSGGQAHSPNRLSLRGPHRRERAWKSTLTCQSAFAATREPPIPSPLEKAGLGSIGNRRGTVAVVVVGVTPHQGERENRSQGKGPQVKSFKTV
jgi:hypothetical protein